MPRLRALEEKFGSRGFEIVSIAFDENAETVRAMVDARGIAWTQICDGQGADGELMKAFNARGFPVYYVIGRAGELLAKKQPLSEIEGVIEAAVEGP